MITLFNTQVSVIDIIGSVIGLVYVVSEYKASKLFWPSSILMSAFYAVLYFGSHCFANASICLYNLVMSVVGLVMWYRPHKKEDVGERPMTSCPRRLVLPLIVAATLLSAVLYMLLSALHESSLPAIDAVSSAITIVGMWMLAQKYWQQWFCWMIVEPLMMLLCFLSGMYFSVIMYAIYEVFCVMGVISWRKIAAETANTK